VAPWNEKFKLLEKLTQYEQLEAENIKLKKQIEIEEELKKEKDNREREIKNEKILEKKAERRVAPTVKDTVEKKVEELRSETTSASDSVSKFSAFDSKKPQTIDSSTDAKEASHSAVLNRKHEHANTGKKATNRSWHTLFCVLSGGRMLFFKDSVTAGKASAASGGQYTGKQTWKGEQPLDLSEAIVEVASDYKKRSNVFRLRLKNGAEYLFQGATSDEMNMWVAKMKEICGDKEMDPSPSEKSSTVNSDKKSKSLFKRK